MESIGALSKKLSDYLDPKKVQQVNKAYNFACEAHSGQYRSSGDPYVTHPIAVASILGNFITVSYTHLTLPTICSV